jgi:ubiquinone biosynthesis protein Coq4
MKRILLTLIYGLQWGWNPTDTAIAIKMVETFFNGALDRENLILSEKMRRMYSSTLDKEFENHHFHSDLNTEYDLKMLSGYPDESLGKEYYLFMTNLGYEPLHFKIKNTHKYLSQALVSLAAKNHDLIHLLYGLYDITPQGKYVITDSHEYSFLAMTASQQPEKHIVPLIMLFVPRIKAFLSGKYDEFGIAIKKGKRMGQFSADLNMTWLTPYLKEDITEVRRRFNIH